MPIQEIDGAFTDVMVVSELRGQYPNVPIASDVDYEALIKGDSSPQFLTLPIGKAGATSGNKRHYDEAFVLELERQTLALKPVGLMGHLSDSERATAFPAEAILWVGTLRVGELLWGKGYLPPGPGRERIHRYKASGKALATSIDAHAGGKWDESLGAYRMDAKSLKLGQIDLAPADRAGIPDLAAVPLLTSEMDGANSVNLRLNTDGSLTLADGSPSGFLLIKETPMGEKTKLEIITEMTADDARLLPTVVRDAVVAATAPAPEIAQVTELRSIMGLDPSGNLAEAVKGMQKNINEQRVAMVNNRVRELLEDQEKGIKVEAVRPLVRELVLARKPQSVAEAETAFTEICAMQSVKDALAATVISTMGPNQRTAIGQQNGKATFFQIPENGKGNG
jgi:hypothetical protein